MRSALVRDQMAGLYIHIPFCRKRCNYCDFHFSTDLSRKEAMVTALYQELILRHTFLSGQKVESIYFGGGTPSLLNREELTVLLKTITKYYQLSSNIEITLEANPNDLSRKKLQVLYAAGINRLSIGVQSFSDEDLRFMRRIHTALESRRCIAEAQKMGFYNISIDLIYGATTTTHTVWLENLEQAFASGVVHLSAYALTVEPRTQLHHWIRSKKISPLDEDKQVQQYRILTERIAARGFAQYEVSNFGKKQYFSKHNTNYWKHIPYLGIGPSAHSFDGQTRQWNVRNNYHYIKSLRQGLIPAKNEVLSPADHYNEHIMMGLRTIWGVDLNRIKESWGIKYYDHLLREAKKFLQQKILSWQGEHLLLSKTHWLYADGIAAALFFITKNCDNLDDDKSVGTDRHF